MAIDFSKFTSSPNTPTSKKTGIDFSKFVPASTKVTQKTSSLPDFLGGGEYYNNVSSQDPALKEYGGIKPKTGSQLDHITPYQLGGTSNAKNIKQTPLKLAKQADIIENKYIDLVKSGKMGLNEARVNAVSEKRNINEGLTSQMNVGKNWLKEMGNYFTAIPKGIYNALTKPSEESKQVEKLLGFNDTIASKVITFPAKIGVRLFQPMLQPLANNIGQYVATKEISNKVSKGEMPTEALDDIQFLQKSRLQVAGDAAQAVLAAYMPSVELGIGGTALKSGTTAAIKQSLNKGTIPAAMFGLSQVASSGTKDPLEIANIMAQNIVGMTAFNVMGAAALSKIKLSVKQLDTIKNQVKTPEMKKTIGDAADLLRNPVTLKEIVDNVNQKQTTNAYDPTIKYQHGQNLGKDSRGAKVLGRTEYNYKTGEATVLLDKSLDKNPELKKAVLDHEHGHIIDKRLGGGTNLSSQLPNYAGNKSVLDKTLADFSEKIGKTNEEISAAITAELTKSSKGIGWNELFADAVKQHSKDPIAFKKKAPVLSDLLDFQTNPNIEVKPTTAKNILEDTIKQHEALIPKEENPNVIKTVDKTLAPTIVEGKSPLIAGTGMKTGKPGVKTETFNPKSINAPDDVYALYEKLGAENKNFATQRVAKNNADLRELARMVDLTPEQLMKTKPGSIANAETLTKSRQIVLDKATELTEFARSIDRDTATQAQLKEVRDKWLQLVSMQKAVSGLRTEAANTLRSLGLELMPGENAAVADLLSNIKKLDIDSNGDMGLFSKNVAKDIKLTGTQRVGSAALDVWYSAILSGPKTSIRNIFSTGANIITDALSELTSKNARFLPDRLAGMFKGLVEGKKDFWDVLTGKDQITSKFTEANAALRDQIWGTGRLRKIGNIVEMTGKFLNAQDRWMKRIASEGEMASFIKKYPEVDTAIVKAITDAYGERTVYHGEPTGPLLKGLRNSMRVLRREAPMTKVIIPFVDTVANVTDRNFDYLPLSGALRLRKGLLENQANKIIKDYSLKSSDKNVIIQRLRDQQVGRVVLGTLISTGAVSLAMQGRISGNGPSDANLKGELTAKGWRPNSVKIGETWVPFLNWGPLTGIFSMAGNISDSKEYDGSGEKSLTALGANGLKGFAKTQLSQSFLSGIANLFDAVNGNTTPEQYAKNIGVGLVPIPALYTQTKDLIKPDTFYADTFTDKIKNKLGITDTLQPKLDVFGHQMKADIVAGITPSKIKDDPVLNFLTENKLTVSMPSRNTAYKVLGSDKEQKLTPEQYTKFVQDSGSQIYDILSQNIDEFSQMDKSMAEKQVDKIVNRVRDNVRKQVLYGNN